MSKKRKNKSRKRTSKPIQPTCKIVPEDFPQFIAPPAKSGYIISIRCEDGIPWHELESLLGILHDLRYQKKTQAEGGFEQ